jgi:uncharacterized protein (TIRG00374 family)
MSRPFTEFQAARRGGRLGRVAKLAVGLATSALFLYATLASVSTDQLFASIGAAKWEWLAVALASITVDFGVKVYRWRTMLRVLGAQVGMLDAAIPFMGCVALNNVLPFRAGDVVRVVAFRRITKLPTSAQLGTLVLERLLDLFVLIGLLLVPLSIGRIQMPQPILERLEVASAAILLALAVFLMAPASIARPLRRAEARWQPVHPVTGPLLRLLQAISSLTNPLLLARLVALSLLAWLAEGGAFLAVGYALGIAMSAEAALLALAVGTLSTLIPSSPGYIGTFHYFTAATMVAFGVGEAESTAYAVLIHGLLWASTTACGLILLSVTGLGSALRSAARNLPDLETRQSS